MLSGGQEQIARLMKSLRAWLMETLQCHSDPEYVERRWNIGLRHVRVGLDRTYTSVAMARLRTGVTRILRDSFGHSLDQMYRLIDSFNKLFDLELTIIQNAYQAESLKLEKVAEHERSEVIFRALVEAAAQRCRQDAATLYAPINLVYPAMGDLVITKAFVIIILGGMGSVPGAIFGSLFIALIESVGGFLYDPSIANMAIFVLVMIVLMVRPQGLLGRG